MAEKSKKDETCLWFRVALEELGYESPGYYDVQPLVAKKFAQKILKGEKNLIEGARELYRILSNTEFNDNLILECFAGIDPYDPRTAQQRETELHAEIENVLKNLQSVV